jgi:sugar-specific transcriptional regulator TrmB
MDGYLVWLFFLAFAIFALCVVQLQTRRSRVLERERQQLQKSLQMWQERLRERERTIDELQRRAAQLLKWRDRASELEQELVATKKTERYASAKRLQYLEEHMAAGNPSSVFLSTFQPRGQHTFEERLGLMLEEAQFEVVIVSPWIKRQTWDKIKGPLRKFARKGGRLLVFTRGCESDYTQGLSDDIMKEVADLKGEVISVRPLHAKIYMADRKQAIIASANLTKGGFEGNYEAGVWMNDPSVLKDICAFVEDLHSCRQSL